MSKHFSFSPDKQIKIRALFLPLYQNFANYLDSKYNFSISNLFSKLNIFSLKTPFKFDSVVDIITNLLIDINVDNLYENFCIIKPTIEKACALPEQSVIDECS